ncbi:MAG: HDOD domain-containing protein [Acidobacteria bacterium]|nr:HDOD domain-containing protein [Acidobacteriota bacterium]
MSAACETPVVRVEGLRNLPPFPRIALQILELLSNDEARIRELTNLLNSDPAFAAEIIGAANSALFSYHGKVTTVPQAVVRVGFVFMKSLAMTVAMRSYIGKALRLPVLRRVWVHSVATAVLAEELAAAVSFENDCTYTAALLHDIGRLGLLAAYGERYARMLEQAGGERVTLQASEREVFGLDHCQAGEWLATEWQLPAKIVDVIRSHHTANLESDPVSVGSVVAAACRFSESLGFGSVALPARIGDAQALDSLPLRFRPRATRDITELRAYVIARINAFA